MFRNVEEKYGVRRDEQEIFSVITVKVN